METTQSPDIVRPYLNRTHTSRSMAQWLFDRMLRRFRRGSLQVEYPDGRILRYGDGLSRAAVMRIFDQAFFPKVVAGGAVAFGDAYVEGYWDSSDLSSVLRVFALNQGDVGLAKRGLSMVHRFANRMHHMRRRNSLSGSRDNIEAHYDLSNDFYSLFLDRSMTYSSGYFDGESGLCLEAAQLQKIERLLDLAGVGPGDWVLEIGSGWGALAIAAARRGAQVKTITLSKEQRDYAMRAVAQAGLSDLVEVALEDYREQDGHYDAVISCEMIEAVGKEYLPSYFETIQRCLRPGVERCYRL